MIKVMSKLCLQREREKRSNRASKNYSGSKSVETKQKPNQETPKRSDLGARVTRRRHV